jgi:anti-sigma B factor antagonist
MEGGKMDWKATESADGKSVEVRIRGECDLYGAPAFTKTMIAGIGRGWREVVLDCTELSYLDSTGVGSFIRVLQELRKVGGRMGSRGVGGAPRKVLTMSNILPLLNEEKTGR